jgi:tRNA pseudouridine13 synthase
MKATRVEDGVTVARTHAFGGPVCRGVLRSVPEDFQVREIPPCRPQGAGEHVWLLVRKREANTEWVARQIAGAAGVAMGDIGYAGLKDRHSATEQWFSIRMPGRGEPDWGKLDSPAIHVLEACRHTRKLRRGALRGNRFRITVRSIRGDRFRLQDRLRSVGAGGVPNYFGEQRFGHDGGNLDAAAAMFADPAVRLSRHRRGLYLSAARSCLFNHVLAARVAEGTWNGVLPGEVVQLAGSRSRFCVGEVDDAIRARAAAMDLHPTGPLWGRGDPPARGECLALEQAVLAPFAAWRQGLERAGLEQDRRALRLPVRALEWSVEGDDLLLAFELPAGGYATAVLRELIVATPPAASPADRRGQHDRLSPALPCRRVST